MMRPVMSSLCLDYLMTYFKTIYCKCLKTNKQKTLIFSRMKPSDTTKRISSLFCNYLPVVGLLPYSRPLHIIKKKKKQLMFI